jgi:hypothetical protein
MAKKKRDKAVPRTEAPEPTYEDRHTSPRVVFHLPDELLAVIDREAEENDRTRTGEILRALKAYYRDKGLWPPAGQSD